MAAGVYIHIPFCVRKCLYCDFTSGCGTEEEKDRYNRALINEIKSTEIDRCVDTIFFGGGTPSLYPARYICEVMEELDRKNTLSEKCEITLEANPGTLDKEKLRYYKDIGINRLSIGLQSTEDSELKMLGRIHDYRQFLESFDNAREAGFDNINIDIMSAIPSQTIASYERTLKRVTGLSPEHISAYSLIIEEGTPFYDKYGEDTALLPSEDEEREMYYLTKQILAESGYARYEISNYARSGHECRHNLKYWNRDDYYGFGVSAASLVGNVRYTNISDRDSYTEYEGTTDKIRGEQHVLTGSEQIEEFMFLGLRKMEGVSADEFETQFGKTIEEVYGNVIQKAEEQGLLFKDERENRICLTDRGIDVSNIVLAEFLL